MLNAAVSENSPHRNPSRDSGLWQSQALQVSSKAIANHAGSQATLLESPVLNKSFHHALHQKTMNIFSKRGVWRGSGFVVYLSGEIHKRLKLVFLLLYFRGQDYMTFKGPYEPKLTYNSMIFLFFFITTQQLIYSAVSCNTCNYNLA